MTGCGTGWPRGPGFGSGWRLEATPGSGFACGLAPARAHSPQRFANSENVFLNFATFGAATAMQ